MLDTAERVVYTSGIASVYKSDIDIPLYSQFSGLFLGQIVDIAVDTRFSPDKVFMVTSDGIHVDDADGAALSTLVNTGVTNLSGIDASTTTQRIYFSDRGTGDISSVDYNGAA